MIDPLKYEPLHWSETLLSVLPGQPPFLGCGVSTAAEGIVMASAGQYGFMPDGRLKGKAARTNDLKRGWKAFKAKPDSNGIPDTDDYIRIHRAMAPKGMPDPEKLWTRRRADIEEALDGDMFISIAVRLSAVRGTAAARYTTADHQMGIWKRSPKGKTKRIDPMHPYSYDKYHGDWIDLDDVIKAAKAINDGTMLCWLYPIGGWTQEAALQRTVRRVRAQRNEANATIAARDVEIAALRLDLAQCEEDGSPAAARLAALEQAQEAASDAIEALKD